MNNPKSEASESISITYTYDDRIVRLFAAATILWGIVAAALTAATSVILVQPTLTAGNPEFAFGRIQPLHLNAVLYAFVANAIFTGIYYSVPRLCQRPMFLGFVGYLHWSTWQVVVAASLCSISAGTWQLRSLTEAEWPYDLAIGAIWILFGTNILLTIYRRRQRHMYVSLWFYIATIIGVPIVYAVNNIALIQGEYESLTIFAGVQDAYIQSWFGQAIVSFLAVIPVLGMMYYFIPKISGEALHSYRLAVLQFWALTCLTLVAAGKLLHFTVVPDWLSTMAMLSGLILWMPNWAGVINGLTTLKCSQETNKSEPSMGFCHAAILVFAVATFESAITSIKSVGAWTAFTELATANTYALTFGWTGLMITGIIYWLLPRLFQTSIWSEKLVSLHYVLALLGVVALVGSAFAAGITQSFLTHGLDDTGNLKHPEFLEIVTTSTVFWWIQAAGSVLIMFGMLLLATNFAMTWFARAKPYTLDSHSSKKLTRDYQDQPLPASKIAHAPVLELATKIDSCRKMTWHRRWERLSLKFTGLVGALLIGATLIAVGPTLLPASEETAAAARPYTPLELAGREIFMQEGCCRCHTQAVRAVVSETKRYGDYSKLEDSFYDQPSLWGKRRVGPDLARESGKQDSYWHWRHLDSPQSESEGSVMPSFRHLLFEEYNLQEVSVLVDAARSRGMPIKTMEPEELAKVIEKQAEIIAADIVTGGGPAARFTQKATALIAYLQRLGAVEEVKPPAK